jgi:hypothetical protein
MASDFLLQVINRHTGVVVTTWEPGSHAETDMVEGVMVRLGEVGVFRGREQVKAAVRAAWAEHLKALKSVVAPLSHD